jgi:hypothetical protein
LIQPFVLDGLYCYQSELDGTNKKRIIQLEDVPFGSNFAIIEGNVIYQNVIGESGGNNKSDLYSINMVTNESRAIFGETVDKRYWQAAINEKFGHVPSFRTEREAIIYKKISDDKMATDHIWNPETVKSFFRNE